MKTFVIISGKHIRFIKADNMDHAKQIAINYCDHSQEIIVREFTTYDLKNVTDPQYKINLPFNHLTKGAMMEFVFGKGFTNIDTNIPQDVFNKLEDWGVSTFWYVWDYRENKIGGNLCNLANEFYEKVKADHYA